MSFLGKPFDHDVFVSYSHGDVDGSGQSNLKTWSQAFVRELEGELRMDPKFRELKVFFDQHHRPDQGVDPMQDLTPQLKDDIEATGLLTVLMSPHYLLSNWCTDERNWWFDCQQRTHNLSSVGRVAISRVWPVEEDWPDELTDERGEPPIGFPFHGTNRPQPFEWPDPTGAKGEFRDRLLDLVGAIWRNLGELKDLLEERRRHEEDAGRLAAESGQLVYLHGRDTHAEAWQSTDEALQSDGFTVLPGQPEPVEQESRLAREVDSRRIETLSGCDGLLLLGTDDDRALEADLAVVGFRNRNSARARSNRLLPCAVVNTAEDASRLERQKGVASKLGIGWIDAAASGWTGNVSKLLQDASGMATRA